VALNTVMPAWCSTSAKEGAPVSPPARCYGVEPDIGIVRAGIERTRGSLGQMQKAAADGSAHEVELARRGLFDEVTLEIAWVEEHAVALLEA